MKWVFTFTIILTLAACIPPPLELVPVETLAAQTMAAMPKTDTPFPSATAAVVPNTETPTLEAFLAAPGAACVPLTTERWRGLVTRIIDGESIEVAIGNTAYRIRYIGLDAPGITPTLEFQGPLAIAANETFVMGKTVTLIKDVSDADTNGFYLRYVLVENAFVNYELIRQGYAKAVSMPPDIACDQTFNSAQAEAQAGRLVIWVPTPTFTGTITKTPTNTATITQTLSPACDCKDPRVRNCNFFATQAEAQACYEYCKSLKILILEDKNNNGKVCEGLP